MTAIAFGIGMVVGAGCCYIAECISDWIESIDRIEVRTGSPPVKVWAHFTKGSIDRLEVGKGKPRAKH